MMVPVADAEAGPVPGPVRVVARTGVESPKAGAKYRRIRGWVAGKGGDVAIRAQVEAANGDTEDVIVREGSARAVIVSAATPPPTGAWGSVADGALGARGGFYFWSTTGAEVVWWGLDTTSGSVRRLFGSNDVFGGKPAGQNAPVINSQGHVLVAASGGLFALNNVGVQKPVYLYLGAVTGLPAEWTAPATGVPIPAFLDENGLLTAAVEASRTVGATTESKRFTMHGGVDGPLTELAWAQPRVDLGPNSYYGQEILHVGGNGAMVGLRTTEDSAASTTKRAYHSGDGLTMTPAFELVTTSSTPAPLTLDGVAVTQIAEVRSIDNTSFVFVAGDTSKRDLFVWSGGAAKRLAGPGMDAPGTGAKFDSFASYAVNRRGQVFIVATVGGKGAYFLAEPGQAPTLLAQEGMDLSLDDGRTVPITVNANQDAAGLLGDDGSIVLPVGTSASPPEQILLSRGDASAPTADLELTGVETSYGSIKLTVKNLGPASANGVRLTVRGQGVKVQFDADKTCTSGSTEVTCALPIPLEAGVSWPELYFETDKAGTTLEASVYGPSDPNLSNNNFSWTYEPKSSQDSDGGCSSAPNRQSSQTAIVLAVLALGALGRRRTKRS